MAEDDNKKRGRIRFEIEEDADELFHKALENIDPAAKKEEPTQTSVPKSARTRPQAAASMTLDLHGMTLAEAEAAVDRLLGPIFKSSPGRIEIVFITGKGRHSGPGGSVLPRGVHLHVKKKWGRYIEQIESSPADAVISGMPIRGHFTTKFKW